MRTVAILRVDVKHKVHFGPHIMLMFAVDYNSWQESEKGRRLAASLDRDIVLAEGMSYHRFF